jgi:hypothetical protein
MAAPLEDPSWKRLPFFEADIRGWPFARGWALEGRAIDEAAKWAAKTSPGDRSAHPSLAELDEIAWERLVLEHWPRLRDRFVRMLERIRPDEQAVLLLENELSHGFWPGDLWPQEVSLREPLL